jgi:D-serine deaminase-like pyridoxal phosphate-dependent protein
MQTFKQIQKPTMVLDKAVALKNLANMAKKAANNHLIFRPHFKTHQSAEIGSWFRENGILTITVSSIEMAQYFADHGWADITIAFPVNLRQLSAINELAQHITLNLLLDAEHVAMQLNDALTTAVNVWLEIDAGYHRTGLRVGWVRLQSIRLPGERPLLAIRPVVPQPIHRCRCCQNKG